jgi:putative NIF3 family GTP cyclohydrolase 1 type 2
MITVSEVMASLDAIAPQHLCMENDPRGLLLGDPQSEVSRLVVCLDITPAVAETRPRGRRADDHQSSPADL